jgi:hypothetical protein
MSMVTVGKNGHVYRRGFDHDEARVLHNMGWSYNRIAKHMGVSFSAVRRVLNENAREYIDAKNKERIRAQRQPCLGGCGTLVWRHGAQGRARSGYCPRCFPAAKYADDVAEHALRCRECDEFLADEQFRLRSDQPKHYRRGRHSVCRECESAMRDEYRQRHKVPCVGCGNPALPPSEKGLRAHHEPRCRDCFHAQRRLDRATA